MDILPLQTSHLDQAVRLFIDPFNWLRQDVPALPGGMASADRVRGRLERLLERAPGMAAVERGEVVGYLAGFFVEHFRGTSRRGAYCPEWGHAAVPGREMEIYRALYRALSTCWAEAGCGVHAISLLANDRAGTESWFWNGFGLIVVDAVRPTGPLGARRGTDLTVRPAGPDDAERVCEIDAEHWHHYTQPPVFMTPHAGLDAAGNREFIARPGNRIWLGLDGERVAGLMRFDRNKFDGLSMMAGEDGVSINGAYVRPEYRGRGLAPALLDAALREYAAQGVAYCAVNFESFNPEAAGFWPRYFDIVAYSLARVPEAG